MKKLISMKVFPKTIYTDLVSLPATLLLGLTIRYYNHTDQTLYMQIQVSGANWSANSVNLGSLASGSDTFKNLDNFSSRSKPASETTEQVTLTLKGYTDAGYTDEFASFSRAVTIIMIKSDDGSWTEDELDNFDDGTVQGWAGVSEENSYFDTSISTAFVLSPPYALKLRSVNGNSGIVRARLFKSFSTPNKDTLYAIFNVRVVPIAETGMGVAYGYFLKFQENSTDCVFLGISGSASISDHKISVNKWIRVVVPLNKNVTEELRIVIQTWTTSASSTGAHLYLDDFKIISRD